MARTAAKLQAIPYVSLFVAEFVVFENFGLQHALFLNFFRFVLSYAKSNVTIIFLAIFGYRLTYCEVCTT